MITKKKVLGAIVMAALLIGSLITNIIRIMHELQVGLLKAIGLTTIQALITVVLVIVLTITIHWFFDE